MGIVKSFKRRWFRVVDGHKITYAEDASKLLSDPAGAIGTFFAYYDVKWVIILLLELSSFECLLPFVDA